MIRSRDFKFGGVIGQKLKHYNKITTPPHQAVTRVAAAILRWPDSLIELEKCNRTTHHDEPTQTGSKVNSSINTRITIHFPSDIVNSYDLISEPQERRNKHLKYTFKENFQIPQKLLMLKFAIFTKFTSEIGLRILP